MDIKQVDRLLEELARKDVYWKIITEKAEDILLMEEEVEGCLALMRQNGVLN